MATTTELSPDRSQQTRERGSKWAPRHERHDPVETTLHALVCSHLETFVARTRESYTRPLPAYVVSAFRAYIACGVLAKGFLRLRCEGCGHAHLVAFSCKGRGVCPSCNARRMTNTAAHMVDRVLPNVPVRQWVLSLPFELRGLAARRPVVLNALSRIFIEGIVRHQRQKLRLPKGHAGAITFVQRFGGSLNLNVHFHVLVLDGLFVEGAPYELRFVPLPAPTKDELLELARRIEERALRWLRRHGHVRSESASDHVHTDERGALDACVAAALARGTVGAVSARDDFFDEKRSISARRTKSIEVRGFDVHASVRVAAEDDVGREKLVRYCARPPFALEGLSVLADGRVAYRVKYPRGNATHRLMTPVELLARIAALIPPPRYPLVRYHGILAPHSKLRAAVVPRVPAAARARGGTSSEPSSSRGSSSATPPPPTAIQVGHGAHVTGLSPGKTRSRVAAEGHAWKVSSSPGARPANELSAKHLTRLDGGTLLAASPRIDWARLLRRTFEVDVLSCPSCGGRLRLVAEITDPEVISKILEHLDQPTSGPPLARARAPDEELGAYADA